MNPSERHWRTLVRVEERDDGEGNATVFVPAWDPERAIQVSTADLPSLAYGVYCHVWACTGCEKPEGLNFKDWEAGTENPDGPYHDRLKAAQQEREST